MFENSPPQGWAGPDGGMGPGAYSPFVQPPPPRAPPSPPPRSLPAQDPGQYIQYLRSQLGQAAAKIRQLDSAKSSQGVAVGVVVAILGLVGLLLIYTWSKRRST